MHSTRVHASEAVHQGSQTIAISPCLVIDMYTFLASLKIIGASFNEFSASPYGCVPRHGEYRNRLGLESITEVAGRALSSIWGYFPRQPCCVYIAYDWFFVMNMTLGPARVTWLLTSLGGLCPISKVK